MVNILAPIMTDETASVRQTTFFPLREYRAKGLKESVKAEAVSPAMDTDVGSLDVSATIDRERGRLNLFVVNLNPKALKTRIVFENCKADKLIRTTVLSAASLDARNTLDDRPGTSSQRPRTPIRERRTKSRSRGESVTICEFALSGR